MDELTGPLVSTDALAAALADPATNVQIVDGSWRLDKSNGPAVDGFIGAHLPGAVFFDLDAVSDQTSDLPHMLPTPAAFAEAVAALGLSPDVPTIVYDEAGLFSAARVWWTFKAMGWRDVAVLDGGLPKWRTEGRPLESGASTTKSAPQATSPHEAPFRVAAAKDVLRAIATGDAKIIDARPAPRFQGSAPEPRAGLRSGAMPSAVNIPFAALLSGDGRLKPAAQLAEIFDAAGVAGDDAVIASCGSGVTAAIIILALAVLGREKHALYDGSFAEWGDASAAERFPVVTAL
ncbi:MAG: 3-mercaptopyruvate sulfurtransferase [Pseudomonadota bacterium]